MNLNPEKFYKSTALFKTHNGETVQGTIYSYESKHKLYDVVEIPGLGSEYRTNMARTEPTEFHHAIIAHFMTGGVI